MDLEDVKRILWVYRRWIVAVLFISLLLFVWNHLHTANKRQLEARAQAASDAQRRAAQEKMRFDRETTRAKQERDRQVQLETQAKEQQARVAAAAAAETDRRQSLQRHRQRMLANPWNTPRSARKRVSVSVTNASQNLDNDLSTSIASFLRREDIETTSSLLTAHFASDGILESILLKGDFSELEVLELGTLADYLVLAKYERTNKVHSQLANSVSTTMDLQMAVIRVSPPERLESFTIRAVGGGFSEMEATSNAKMQLMGMLGRRTWHFE